MNLTTLRKIGFQVRLESAESVRMSMTRCVLQFAPINAASCVLHRPVSRVIHRLQSCLMVHQIAYSLASYNVELAWLLSRWSTEQKTLLFYILWTSQWILLTSKGHFTAHCSCCITVFHLFLSLHCLTPSKQHCNFGYHKEKHSLLRWCLMSEDMYGFCFMKQL